MAKEKTDQDLERGPQDTVDGSPYAPDRKLLDDMQKLIESDPSLRGVFDRFRIESTVEACQTLEDAERMIKHLDEGKLAAGGFDRNNLSVPLRSTDGKGEVQNFSAMHSATLIEKYGMGQASQMMGKHFTDESLVNFGFITRSLPLGRDVEALDHPVKDITPVVPDISRCTMG